jgi:hypothetical protein
MQPPIEVCEGPPAARTARAQNVRPCSFLSSGALLDQWLIPAIFALESLASGSQVLSRLRAGGIWIRTFVSWSRDRQIVVETGLWLSRKPERICWGTEGTNPSPSSGESDEKTVPWSSVSSAFRRRQVRTRLAAGGNRIRNLGPPVRETTVFETRSTSPALPFRARDRN